MINKIKVDFVVYLSEKLGTGPLKTVVYKGTYGLGSSLKNNKNTPKDVLLKKIALKIVADKVDWEVLQKLDHPNVARYILVHDKANIFTPNVVYLIQDFCQYTLCQFVENIDQIEVNCVLKKAVKEIASGLSYLHAKQIIHKNLKPTNVLVKPPLTDPDGFILTDYWYTNHRSLPEESCWCCIGAKKISDNPEIIQWMAPELLVESSETVDEVQINTFADDASDCSILELQEERGVVMLHSTMADVFSFGKVVEFMFQNVTSLDNVDDILCKLLIKQMTSLNPTDRISSQGIAENHPFLIVQPRSDGTGVAEARMDYIKDRYDCIKTECRPGPGGPTNLRKKIEEDVDSVTCKFFPWNEPLNSFNMRIHTEMNKRAKNYNPHSFMDLLRLIRNTKEHPPEGKRLEALREEIAADGFSKSFPYVLPLIYICVECKDASNRLIGLLNEIQIECERVDGKYKKSDRKGRK